MSRRAFTWGAIVAVVYAAVAVVSFASGLLPARPLYDGLAPPPPYNYVNPPRDLAEDNRPPSPGSGTVGFTEEGSEARSLATGDGQAIVIFSMEAIPPREDVETVEATLTPLDPRTIGEPPNEMVYDGNAYRLDLVYEGTDDTPELERPLTVVLRYPIHAEVLLWTTDGEWEELRTDIAPASQQLFADAPAPGTFVAAGPPPEPDRRWTPIVIAVLGVLAAIGGYVTGRRPSKASQGSPPKRSKAQKKTNKRK